MGGIQTLFRSIAGQKNKPFDNCYCLLFTEGSLWQDIQKSAKTISLVKYGERKITFKRICELIKAARDYDIIAVHNSEITVQVLFLLLKKKYPSKKYVLVAHSCYDSSYYFNYSSKVKNWVRKIVLKQALFQSDQLIFVSNAGMESYLSAYPLDKAKCAVVYNGIRLPEEMKKLDDKSDKKCYQIVYIGRLAEEKGIELLINAVLLLKEIYSIELYIVGDGSERIKLEQLSWKNGCGEIIHFEGEKKNIENYLRGADVFVYPSVCKEVFGISIIEAMSYGVPCVANRVGGIPEIISDCVNGKLSDTMTSNGIAGAIEWILQKYKSGVIDSIVNACYKTAEQFTIEKTVKGYDLCYRKLVNKLGNKENEYSKRNNK